MTNPTPGQRTRKFQGHKATGEVRSRKAVTQPGRGRLVVALLLLTLSIISLAISTDTGSGWSFTQAPVHWNWERLVDLTILGLGISMLSTWAHRTAAWLKG